MPAVLNNLSAVPAKTPANVITSLETRVLNCLPRPLPVVTNNVEPHQAAMFMMDLPNHHHPLGPVKLTQVHRMNQGLPVAKRNQTMVDLRELVTKEVATHQLQAKIPLVFNQNPLATYDPSNVNPSLVPLQNTCVLPNGTLMIKKLPSRLISVMVRVPGWYWQKMLELQSWGSPTMMPTTSSSGPTRYTPISAQLSQDVLSLPSIRSCANLHLASSLLAQEGYLTFMAVLYTYDVLMEITTESLAPVDFETWLLRYPENRRNQLRTARDRVERQGWLKKDRITRNFLKIEPSDGGTDPRNISPRSDEFLSALGPYISALEHALVDHPALVKGLDLDNRMEKMSGNNKYSTSLTEFHTFLETDYSRFDLSISAAYIRSVERVFLASPFLGEPGYLQLLGWLVATKGISEIGLTYDVVGTRCSGDAHTSIANGLINHFNTWLALSELPSDSWISFHEGDDGVIGVKKEYADQAIHNMHVMPVLGFQLKLDVYKYIGDVSFCGRYIYDQVSGLDSYCDVRRTLAKLHTITSDGDPESLLLAKMISYYCTDRATPVIGVLSCVIIQLLLPVVSTRRLTRAINHLKRSFWFREKHKNHLMIRDSYPLVLSDAYLRASVSRRCHIDIQSQLAFEQYYLSWLDLGFIPEHVDKIPGFWNFKHNMHVHGSPRDWVA
jgi:hypothetical protein